MIDTSMLPDFLIEATEHLEEMESSLLRLEQHKEDKDVLDALFRSVHTIKGAAQFVGIEGISKLSHKLENLLDLIRKGAQPLTAPVTDLLIEAKDRITLLSEELERTQAEDSRVDDLLERIRRIVEGEAEPEPAKKPEPAPPAEQSVATVYEEPRKGTLAEENMSEEYDEELYNIFLQQLKENIPFLYAQTVELSLSVDKQDVLYRCSDSIKSLKSSANYMGYEKLARHYSEWQQKISSAVEQLSSGKMPDLSFMQEYIDEIIRSFPQAMEGYDDAEEHAPARSEEESVELALNKIFEPAGQEDEPDKPVADKHREPDEEDEKIAFPSPFPEDVVAKEEDEEEPVIAQPAVGKTAVPPPTLKPKKRVALEYELSDDEYDQELVAIFLKKLKTDIRFIREQAEEMDKDADKRAVLERCRDAVGRLASSANYMEYMNLTAFCEAWQQTLTEDLAGLSGGQQLDSSHLKSFIDEIVRVYPQAADSEPPAEPQKKEKPQAAAAEGLKAAPRREDELEDAASTAALLFSSVEKEAVKEPQPPAAARKETQEEAATPEKRQKPAPVVPPAELPDRQAQEEEQALFAKLSTALEQSLFGHPDAGMDPMDSVIEKIIDAADTEEKAEKAAAPETKPPVPAEPAPVKALPLPVAAPPAAEKEAEEEAAEKEEKALTEVFSSLAAAESKKEAKPERPIAEEDEDRADEEDSAEDDQAARKAARKGARSSIRVDAEKIDYLLNQVGELVVSRAYFAQLVNEMRGLQQHLIEHAKLTKSELKPLHEFAFRLSEAGVHLGRVSNELQEGVMKIRMLPIEQLFKRYPRLVRDLTHKTGKDVRLVTRGEETELDKMVIESISDPLIHIIRNAVDHGIEGVAERRRLGKPPQGTLMLEAFHESDHIVLEITDDGRGIDVKRIRAKALEKKMFRRDELDRMSETELIRIIMEPGFSTAEKTTETSGRGVGMDVVKKNVERLNGTVDIASQVGKGTRLRIKIPLTMAIIQALMVRVGKEKFTIPLTTVEETLRIFRQEISEIEGVDVIHIRDITMPIFQLAKIYNIEREKNRDEEKMFVVVVSNGTQEVGLVVDELLGQEEVVIKPLADYLRMESGFGGATILGDGGISLILDIPELVKIAAENQASRQEERAAKTYKKRRRKRKADNAEGQPAGR